MRIQRHAALRLGAQTVKTLALRLQGGKKKNKSAAIRQRIRTQEYTQFSTHIQYPNIDQIRKKNTQVLKHN